MRCFRFAKIVEYQISIDGHLMIRSVSFELFFYTAHKLLLDLLQQVVGKGRFVRSCSPVHISTVTEINILEVNNVSIVTIWPRFTMIFDFTCTVLKFEHFVLSLSNGTSFPGDHTVKTEYPNVLRDPFVSLEVRHDYL